MPSLFRRGRYAARGIPLYLTRNKIDDRTAFFIGFDRADEHHVLDARKLGIERLVDFLVDTVINIYDCNVELL